MQQLQDFCEVIDYMDKKWQEKIMFRFKIQALPWRLFKSGQSITEEKNLISLMCTWEINFKEGLGTSTWSVLHEP